MNLSFISRYFLKLYSQLYKNLAEVRIDGKILDRQTQLLLHMARKAPDLSEGSVSLARFRIKALSSFIGRVRVDPQLVIKSESLNLENGEILPVRRYKLQSSDSPYTLLYLHGGGGVVGDLYTHDALCSILAKETGVEVISLDYPLAPEHPYPAAVNSLIKTYKHFLKIKPAKHLLLGGDSAGAKLALCAQKHFTDASIPMPKMQLLIYPWVPSNNETLPSMEAYGKDFFLTIKTIQWFRAHYGLEENLNLFENLNGIAPAFVVTAGFDPILDHGLLFRDALVEQGVTHWYMDCPQLIHGFVQMAGVVDEARLAIENISREFKKRLEEAPD